MILDTSVLVASEKHKLELRSVIGHDDPAVAAITATELLLGVERTDDHRRDERAVRIEGIFAVLPIEAYTLEVARSHAMLLAHVSRVGRPRGSFDLIIAATACATGRTLITADQAAAFHQLPGVRAEVVRVR
ncbi:PIN domain-containing protein [Actinophytocola sp.]|uniref:PIN domain-containing protein n=1 Tax=Actinophytocola sp. TaxID=1872138 RepID=UPI002D7EAA2E|nr:PIN domain-containing protein [Actinophytocola sp.]HET9142851.1 PIN domain-containing protein [Actinophytocola sp.]